ncbi:MAG: hypothetical protein V4465_02465 [Patescibacteria group bacterium]
MPTPYKVYKYKKYLKRLLVVIVIAGGIAIARFGSWQTSATQKVSISKPVTEAPLTALPVLGVIVTLDSAAGNRRYEFEDPALQEVRDSVESGLLKMARETYLGGSASIGRVVVEKDTSGYVGVFYYTHPRQQIGITISRILAPAPGEWRSTLSHEMGHFYSPDFQKILAASKQDPQARVDSIEHFALLFRNAHHEPSSFVYSGEPEVASYYKALKSNEMTEEEFFSQYFAEAMSCYFEFCNDANGKSLLSTKETELFDQYLAFVEGPFDRTALFLKRLEEGARLAPLLTTLRKAVPE